MLFIISFFIHIRILDFLINEIIENDNQSSLIGKMTDMKFNEDKVEGIFLDERVVVFFIIV